MKEIFITYKEQILLTVSFLYIPFIIFIISLAMVYLFGRMLNVVKTNKSKNIIAFLSMLSSYGFYFFLYDTEYALLQKTWHILIYLSVSILFYVLLGFKLYDRVDQLLDKAIPDNKTKGIIKKKH